MISVVIPAYNEEGAIVSTIDQVHAVLKQSSISPYEIIVVDDGSTDKTSEKLNECDAVIIRHPHNIGYGRSLKDGITRAQYDTIVITDADSTYPFEDVPKLLAVYNQGFDMVVGARTGKHYRESTKKSFLRGILRFIVEFSAERKIPDINSGLRVFSKKKVMSVMNHLCNTFSFTTSLTLAFMMTGKFVKYVEIDYRRRDGRTKVKLLRDSWRTFQYILQAVNYYNPLKIFFLFAALCVLLAIISFAIGATAHLKVGYYLGVGSLLMAIVVTCAGLIADLLKQIMDKPVA